MGFNKATKYRDIYSLLDCDDLLDHDRNSTEVTDVYQY